MTIAERWTTDGAKYHCSIVLPKQIDGSIACGSEEEREGCMARYCVVYTIYLYSEKIPEAESFLAKSVDASISMDLKWKEKSYKFLYSLFAYASFSTFIPSLLLCTVYKYTHGFDLFGKMILFPCSSL